MRARSAGATLLLALGAVALPVAVVQAASSRVAPAAAEGGICTDAGCTTGPTKCVSGTLTTPSGGTATYTCYKTLAET